MTSRAEKALEIYNSHGESTMVEYVALVSREPSQSDLWLNDGNQVLTDESIVQRHQHDDLERHELINGSHYHFLWNVKGTIHTHVRRANGNHVPLPHQPERYLVTWPTADTIVVKVAERADRAAAERANLTHYPQDFEDDLLILSIIHNVAPSARAAVNAAMDKMELPDTNLADLDTIQYEIADEAILKMAAGEFDALAAYISQMTDEQPSRQLF